MTRTAIDLYTVRDLDEPLLEVLDRIVDAGYDGVQFGDFGDATATLVQRYGDRITFVHMKDRADSEFCEIGDPSDPVDSIDRSAAFLNGL